jgi:hypothetical protein
MLVLGAVFKCLDPSEWFSYDSGYLLMKSLDYR